MGYGTSHCKICIKSLSHFTLQNILLSILKKKSICTSKFHQMLCTVKVTKEKIGELSLLLKYG
jgi:hypothetical protein